MKIKISRIDDRFIHGQILTKWLKVDPVDRIIVVCDAVANDEVRKTLTLSVAPSNVKASAVTVEKMARAYHSPRYEDTSVLLLFENPEDIVSLIDLGVPIEIVNVGGLRFEKKRTQVTKAVSVTQNDIDAFQALNNKGVKLELRQLPGDSSVDFIKLLNEKISNDKEKVA